MKNFGAKKFIIDKMTALWKAIFSLLAFKQGLHLWLNSQSTHTTAFDETV